jgi:hypothetical protein
MSRTLVRHILARIGDPEPTLYRTYQAWEQGWTWCFGLGDRELAMDYDRLGRVARLTDVGEDYAVAEGQRLAHQLREIRLDAELQAMIERDGDLVFERMTRLRQSRLRAV